MNQRKFFIKTSLNKYIIDDYKKAEELKKTVELYISGLSKLKLEVARNTKIKISRIENLYVLELKQEHYPQFLNESLIIAKKEEYARLIKILLTSLSIILKREHILYSIDPKADNFAIKNNKLIYVDFLPPFINKNDCFVWLKRKDEGGQKYSWKKKRYFTSAGLIQVFLLRTVIINPKYWKILVALVVEFINQLPNKEKIQIFKSDFYQVLLYFKQDRELNLKKTILGLGEKERDLFRLIFFLLMFKKGNFNTKEASNFLVFSKDPDNFSRIKKILIKSFVDFA